MSMANITLDVRSRHRFDPGPEPWLGGRSVLRQAVNAQTVPGVVAIAATDKGIVYEGAFGPDHGGQRVLDRVDDPKAITAPPACNWSTGQAAARSADGQAASATGAPKVLEGSTPAAHRSFARQRAITLRHLLTHTAVFTYSI